jgi:hypothetical protein
LGLIASTSSRWWKLINDCWWEDAKETSNSHPDVQALINGCRSALYISSKLACILKRKAPNYKTHRWRDHVASLRVFACPKPSRRISGAIGPTHPVRFFILLSALIIAVVHMHLDDVVNAPQKIPLLVYR